MNQLARRHELELMLPVLREEMDLRYSSQIRNMRILAWSVALLLGVAVAVYLWGRLRRIRELAELRERLAADLHDELGANLHTIGLLSDMAEKATNEKPERLPILLRRIRSETERSGEAVRRCSNLLVTDEEYSGLIEDMERSARRIAGEAEHELLVEGREKIERLPGSLLHDLYLFHKECLVNIGRHSEATSLRTRLQVKSGELKLRVEDNGRGLVGDEKNLVPAALKRLDLGLPGMSGHEAIPKLLEIVPEAKIIVISQANQEKSVLDAIALGASGYLLKSATAAQIIRAIHEVNDGGNPLDAKIAGYLLKNMNSVRSSGAEKGALTKRELEVLDLVAKGLVKKEIAGQLGIGETTVVSHVKNIYEKLGTTNAPAAVAQAYEKGLLPRRKS
jgi:DNA-binding NarL/FixJ family response regulator